MSGSTPKQDANLWKAYNASLRKFVFEGKTIDTKAQSFYTAPIGSLGVPAGDDVPQAATNMALYNIADTLFDANNPVFTPGTTGYISRKQAYLGAIQLKKNSYRGAEMRLDSAQKRQADIQEKMNAITRKAEQAFEADAGKSESISFRTWVSRNYPNYDSIRSELQSATNATNSASIDVYSPGAADITRKKEFITKARATDEANSGLNMKVSDSLYRPQYSIDSGYVSQIKQWKGDASAARNIVINIDPSNSSSETWTASGFTDNKAGVSNGYHFISAISQHERERPEHLSAELLDSGVKAKLSAVGIKTFDVKPGSWDGDFAKLYGSKDTTMRADFKLPPACAVSQVVIGYNVSLDITLNSDAAKGVSNLYEKASKNGGSISFLGMPVHLAGYTDDRQTAAKYVLRKNGDDFTSFSITGEDNGQPVLLGVIGRKMPGV